MYDLSPGWTDVSGVGGNVLWKHCGGGHPSAAKSSAWELPAHLSGFCFRGVHVFLNFSLN